MYKLARIVALLRDPRTPKLPKIALALAAAYLLWPADLVPEVLLPVAGYLDDLTFVWLALRWLLKTGKGGVVEPEVSSPPDPRLRP